MAYRITDIDATFPVAGVDNESQGFRDNFSAIVDSLTQAKTDVESLQTTSLNITDTETDLSGNQIFDAQLRACTTKSYQSASVIANQNISFLNGNYQIFTVAADLTFNLAEWPDVNRYAHIRVHLYGDGTAREIQFTADGAGTIYFDAGWPTTLIVEDTGAPIILDFWTYDGGTNVYGSYLGSYQDTPVPLTIDANLSSNLNVSGTATVNALVAATDATVNSSLVVEGATTLNSTLDVTAETTLNNVTISGNLTVLGTSSIATEGVGIGSIDDIGDVVITGPVNGSLLTYNSTTAKWTNKNSLNITDLADVDISNPQLGDLLKYNSSGKWSNNENLISHTVTIADDGSGTQETFFIDGVKLVLSNLKFKVGNKYRFNIADNSNISGPLKFSTTPDTSVPASISTYTTNVIRHGVAGTEGAYVEIYITDTTPSPLYLYADEVDPAIDTSKIGAEYPVGISTANSSIVKITSSYTSLGNQYIITDTSSASISVTLPSSPVVGMFVTVVDAGGVNSNSITVLGNGKNINSSASYVITTRYASLTLIYNGTSWTVVDYIRNGTTIASTATSASASSGALVVAGGVGVGENLNITGNNNVGGTLSVGGSSTLSNKVIFGTANDVADQAAISLVTTGSYFSTLGAETSTLAAGVEGQIKTLAMYEDGGDMVVTVNNAGWKSSGTGTITFDAIGDACTLQYINSKWFCIGNNGATFA